MGSMVLCVMTPGVIRTPLWFADNWDFHPVVSKNTYSLCLSFHNPFMVNNLLDAASFIQVLLL